MSLVKLARPKHPRPKPKPSHNAKAEEKKNEILNSCFSNELRFTASSAPLTERVPTVSK